MSKFKVILTGLFLFSSLVYAASTPSPKKVCETLFQAIEKGDTQAFEVSSLRPELLSEHQQKTQQAGTVNDQQSSPPSIIPKEQMGRLKGMKCGGEHIAGSRAIVEASTKSEKRLIPFVQVDGNWRFDVRTYESFYRG